MLHAVEHWQPDGRVPNSLDDESLTRIAGFPIGRAGVFARELRASALDSGGVLIGWATVNRPNERAARERARKDQDRAERDVEDAGRRAAGQEPLRFDLTPYALAWREQYDGDMARGVKHVRPLRALELEYGRDEVLRRWKVMLSGTDHRFASGAALRQGWGSYTGAAGDRQTEHRRAANAFFDILVTHGLLTNSGTLEKLARLETEGVIKSAEKFAALLRAIDRDTVRNARVRAFAVAHIEERLGPDVLCA